MPDVNLISMAVGGAVTIIAGIVIARAAKHSDLRLAAEAAREGASGPIIASQNQRIDSLQAEIDRLWTQIQETYARERQCREDLGECQRRIVALEAKLGGTK